MLFYFWHHCTFPDSIKKSKLLVLRASKTIAVFASLNFEFLNLKLGIWDLEFGTWNLKMKNSTSADLNKILTKPHVILALLLVINPLHPLRNPRKDFIRYGPHFIS